MTEPIANLPHVPPRDYTLRDAYRGRVWRSPLGVIGRELFFLGLAVSFFGVVQDEMAFILLGGSIGVFGATIGIGGSLLSNLKRVRLISDQPGVMGEIGRPRRVPMFHEIFKGQRESTYILPYNFVTAEGRSQAGRIWICGCARKYLPPRSQEWIVYHPKKPGSNLPLRIAMMVTPHK